MLLDLVPRVIMPQGSTRSQGALCHKHSPDHVNQSPNKHVRRQYIQQLCNNIYVYKSNQSAPKQTQPVLMK
jgi:hypothetical protein